MAILTYKQIKKKVGEAWALIANPVYSDKTGQLKCAELLFFDKDKEKVHNESMKCKNMHIGVFYFGEFPTNQIFIL